MRKLFLLVLVVVLLGASCDDHTPVPNSIIGKWNWISSTGGIAGSTYTPQNTGESIRLEFSSDSMYSQYLNDSLLYRCAFSIIQSESIYNNELTQMIECTGFLRRSFSFDLEGNLLLSDEAADGYIRQYERIE